MKYDSLVLYTLRLVSHSSLRFCYYSECSILGPMYSHVDKHQVRPVLICLSRSTTCIQSITYCLSDK